MVAEQSDPKVAIGNEMGTRQKVGVCYQHFANVCARALNKKKKKNSGVIFFLLANRHAFGKVVGISIQVEFVKHLGFFFFFRLATNMRQEITVRRRARLHIWGVVRNPNPAFRPARIN